MAVYAAVLAVRAMAVRPAGRRRARRNAARIVRLERRLRLHVEPAIQRRALRFSSVVGAANIAYVAANIGCTLGVLAVLLRCDDPSYPALRRSVCGAMLAAQIPFALFPVEPPRRLRHIVDTARDGAGLDLDGPVSRFYNPVAAMPSIHLAWAVISAEGLRRCSPHPLVRRAGRAYPPAVAALVIVTGNHFVLDVVAGAALGKLMLWVFRPQAAVRARALASAAGTPQPSAAGCA